MEAFSALLASCAGNSPVPGEFPAQVPWRGALMFFLICTWIDGCVNSREAGDLRSHRAHYDVIVMKIPDIAPLQSNHHGQPLVNHWKKSGRVTFKPACIKLQSSIPPSYFLDLIYSFWLVGDMPPRLWLNYAMVLDNIPAYYIHHWTCPLFLIAFYCISWLHVIHVFMISRWTPFNCGESQT